MSNADVEDHKINDVVNDLFMRAGLSRQPEISLDDFQRMLGEYKQELSYASLGFEGKYKSTLDSLNSSIY